VNLHQDQATGAFRYPENFEYWRKFGVSRIVDSLFKEVQVDLRWDADNSTVFADSMIPDTEDDSAATTISHADGAFNDLIDCAVAAAADPFLEIEVLILEGVSRKSGKVVKKEADLVGSAHTGSALQRHIGLIVLDRTVSVSWKPAPSSAILVRRRPPQGKPARRVTLLRL
jgi:hypothetical protein